MRKFQGRVVAPGRAKAQALVSKQGLILWPAIRKVF
jgi:hypothetical protein